MSKNPYYKKVEVDKRRGPKPRKNFDANGGVKCKICFEMRNKNEELQIEITRLRLALEKALGETTKTPVGAHTPSSRIDYKANSKEESRLKRGGAKNGHKGFGRKSVTVALADDVIILPMTEKCESCDSALKIKDMRTRTIVESVPVIAKKVIYQCPRGTCPKCKKIYATSPPAMKKCLYGNSLVSQAAVLHYFHGITMGKALSLFGANVTAGGLVDSFHRLGRIAQLAKPYLVDEYRKANARHADETGWRTDGHSGYAWLFCTSKTSIFEFRDSRSSSVAREVLGEDKLDGVLNVDRYGGYNKMPVQLQYCFAHLLREVEKLEKEFPELGEVSHFVSSFSLLLAKAMKLRNQDISDDKYYLLAEETRVEMESILKMNWRHQGIQRIQNIFIEKRHRLYHWVKDREIHADNNRAERELRPTVIARKVSFGSQSDAGARTRSSIMSLLYTVKKRLKDKSIEEWLIDALNKISQDPNINIATLVPQ